MLKKVYSCPRCAYSSYQKNDLRRHFLRKKVCIAVHNNLSISECILQILGEKDDDSKLE
jgi:hypothetical protein